MLTTTTHVAILPHPTHIKQNVPIPNKFIIEFNNGRWNTNVLKAFYPQTLKNLCNDYFL